MTESERDDTAAETTLLEVRNLSKSFEGIVAVDDVSFDITRGQIVGLIGPNGAGKSTTFDLLSGFVQPDSGEINFKGEDIGQLQPHERSLRGMTRTFQITRELVGMSVMENMLLAGQQHPGESAIGALLNTSSVRNRETEVREAAERYLKQLDLWPVRDEYAGNLSGGQRKLLEIGRALMTEPDLMMFDEPVAGVNPELTDRILDQITDLKQELDMTFLIVEHDMKVIMSVSDKIIGMHNGQVITRGPPSKVQQDDELIDAYLGGV
jgi:branched-chain amino acid transport system ATP-binding protein